MELLALVIWVLLAGLAAMLLPLVFTTPGNVLVALAAVAGLAMAIVCIVIGVPRWSSWVQVGFAVIGLAGCAVVGNHVLDGEQIGGTRGEELEGSLLGVLAPLFGTVGFVAFLLASRLTDPIV